MGGAVNLCPLTDEVLTWGIPTVVKNIFFLGAPYAPLGLYSCGSQILTCVPPEHTVIYSLGVIITDLQVPDTTGTSLSPPMTSGASSIDN